MRCKHNSDDTRQQCRSTSYAGWDFCLKHIPPCPWEMQHERKKTKLAAYRASTICGKLPDDNSVYCPKHKLMHDEEKNERSRWAERMRMAKQLKAEKKAYLESSPLRANYSMDESPKFDSR